MKIETLRKLANREEIDYLFLLSALKNYACPREKISAYLKKGELIRIKKGLYIFGESVAQTFYSKEILANLIYGPSAISLTYALSFYNLIPERVTIMSSITPKRNKNFITPIGTFNYYYLNQKKYSVGINLITHQGQQSFLIASVEKALCDQLYLIDSTIQLDNQKAVAAYLYEDLRCSKESLKQINLKKLKEIVTIYEDSRLENLLSYFAKSQYA